MKREDVGLLVAEKGIETRDGLGKLVHYVTERKNRQNISRRIHTNV